MKLKKILLGVRALDTLNFKDYNIKSITHISSDVTADSIFVCIKGNNFDGNDFIETVILNGAKCIVTDSKSFDIYNLKGKSICVIVVEDVRIAMSIMAKNFYNSCVDTMKVIGVVGTAGKTSTTLILRDILSVFDKNIGVIGTNGIFIGNIRLDNKFTTPDPLELHYAFYQMKMLGVKTVIMEVSAQAIYYHKVHGIKFDKCIFTNISNEHLDFFGSMENYAKTKMDFFSLQNVKECVVNTDDFYGRELAFKVDMPCVSYGILEPANSFAIDITFSMDRTTFVANILDDIVSVDVGLIGAYSVYNILAGLTVAKLLGLSGKDLQAGADNISIIDGRFNVYNHGTNKIIVDFAHTPDSMEKLLAHISGFAKGKIIGVFGCVGYSDKQKRIDMACAVAKFCSYIILTTDNRGEVSFDSICDDIALGLSDVPFVRIEDRFSAIKYGFEMLKENDILVLMGKGAEDFQMINKTRVPYSEKECVLKLLEKDN